MTGKKLTCKCKSVNCSSSSYFKQEGEKKEEKDEGFSKGMSCKCNGEDYDEIEIVSSGTSIPDVFSKDPFFEDRPSFSSSRMISSMRKRMNSMFDDFETIF